MEPLGSGCGSVGRAAASYTRDLQFESRHRQNFIYQLYNRKDENKEKEAGNGPSLKKMLKAKIHRSYRNSASYTSRHTLLSKRTDRLTNSRVGMNKQLRNLQLLRDPMELPKLKD